MRVRRLSKIAGFSSLALLVALATACEVDPDLDMPRPPVNPDAGDTGDSGGDGGNGGNDDTGDAGGDTGDDTDTGDNNGPPDGGVACFGTCDCEPHEYCASVGTCQLRLVAQEDYCCSRTSDCPSGAVCHIEGTIHEMGVCPD